MTDTLTINPNSLGHIAHGAEKDSHSSTNKEPASTKPAEKIEIYAQIPAEKVLIMTILTMGLYGFFWWYRNWIIYSVRKNITVRKLLRTIFFPVFCLPLLKDMFNNWADASAYTAIIILPAVTPLVTNNAGFLPLIIQSFGLMFIQLRLNNPAQKEQQAMPYYKIGIGTIIAGILGAAAWGVAIYFYF